MFWVLEKDQMRDLIDASDEADDSLASDRDFRDLAAVMDREGVYNGFMSNRTPEGFEALYPPTDGYGWTPEVLEQLKTTFDRYALDRYDAYGMGSSFDGEQYHLVIALVYRDEQDAEDNADAAVELIEVGESLRAGRPWSDYFRRLEAHADGRVLVVTARADNPRMWAEMISNGDHILYHR